MTATQRLPVVLKWTAFALLAASGLLGSLFVIGETMSDPGGSSGVLLVSLWLVPMTVACVLTYLQPRIGAWVAGAAVTVIGGLWVWYALDTQWWRDLFDDRGPVLAVATFALGLPLAFLGLHRERLAGLLLMVAGAIPILAEVVVRSTQVDGPTGPAGVLGTSGTMSSVPFLVCGALLLAAGLLGGSRSARAQAPSPPIPVA